MDAEQFLSWFDFSPATKDGQEKQKSLVSQIHAVLKPFLLRRLKTDVEHDLPKKREYIFYAPLSSEQRELYREVIDGSSRQYLEDKAVERINSRKGTPLRQSASNNNLKRKLDNDNASGTATPNKSTKTSRASTPASTSSTRSGRKAKAKAKKGFTEVSDRQFFKELDQSSESESEPDFDEQVEIERAKTVALAKKEIATKKLQNPIMQLRLACNSPHNFYWPFEADEDPDDSLVTASGKIMLLDQLLPALFAKGHKVLIFSQFKTTLDILEDYASLLRNWNTCRIDGSIPQQDRRDQIRAFNTDKNFKIFLLSTRAGGQGINLTAADTVILFDSDWNPQQDLQAQDRAHRIGQTRPVIVYRLATKGTVEQTLLEKADGKRRLEKLVIQKGKFKSLLDTRRDKGEEDDLARMLGEEADSEKFEVEGESEGKKVLSDEDLRVLTDRSEAAYDRAARGEDRGNVFKAVEVKGEAGVLEALQK